IESRRQVAGAGNGGVDAGVDSGGGETGVGVDAGAGDGNGETGAGNGDAGDNKTGVGDGNAGDNKTVAGDGDKTVAPATPAFRDLSPAFSAWLTRTSTADPAFQYLLPAGAKTWRDYPRHRRLDLPAQRRACLALVEANNWELYLADFTRPSIGLPVLRVMIPQLRSMHRRLGPGRLYDIPVQLGKLNRARTEEEMNTIDIFI
ncbi:MAG: YcaO-like family protein, partial [Gammaproteobacteria bacterium]|nr:YcaO-like family protein [Gammaproteobacteria bacterium]